MLVSRENLNECLYELSKHTEYGLDTETTGLEWPDRLFSIIIATSEEVYYFNFQAYPGTLPLPRSYVNQLQPIFREGATFFSSNVKFDMLMLMKEGLQLDGTYFCTAAQGRIFQNNLPSYSLAAWAERFGEKKSEAVEKYIAENGLSELVDIPGKKKRMKKMFFHLVPLEVVQPYAEHDANLHLRVGKRILSGIEKMPNPSHMMPANVMRNELLLTGVCADMEFEGVKVDLSYVHRATEYENECLEEGKKLFKQLSGSFEFLDSPKALFEVFSACGYANIPRTDKGNPSFTDENLDFLGGPLADCVKKIRFHEKRIGTYYSSFLHYAGEDGIIHPGIRQGGTETGRFSYVEPNLQNVPKEEDADSSSRSIIRKSFIPSSPDHCFVMVDYNQQEYRMMLDYAGEHELIKQVMAGADVHQAIADRVKISRTMAKTLNFACLYGSGVVGIANMLKIPIPDAENLIETFFGRLPKVKRFIEEVRDKGKMRGYVVNWAGRRCHISDPNWAYVLPNHLIQGGCADVIKFAMTRIHPMLKGTRSRMKLQIHDEILFEFHKDEFHLIRAAQIQMENVYPAFNGMQLTTSVEHSWVSWGQPDKVEGSPYAAATQATSQAI